MGYGIFFVSVVLGSFLGVISTDCPSDFCARVDCLPPELLKCENGRIKPNAGICGCCSACVTILGEGDSCVPSSEQGRVPPTAECGHPFYCDNTTAVCQKKTCWMNLQEKRRRMVAAVQPRGWWYLPRCDSNGNYLPAQCQGRVCFCVNEAGDKTIGGGLWRYRYRFTNLRHMDCRCAKKQYKYSKSARSDLRAICERKGTYLQH